MDNVPRLRFRTTYHLLLTNQTWYSINPGGYKIQFIDIATERTTAVTDIFLGLLAFSIALFIYALGRRLDVTKARIWSWAFGMLSAASFSGAVAHGIKMSGRMKCVIWQPINLALGLTVTLFAAGVVYDMKGFKISRALLSGLVAIGVLFYVISVAVPGTFALFLAYEAAAMVFALVVYTSLAVRGRLAGSGMMSAGILISMIAAAIQASGSVRIQLIWEFDHNSVFHLIQMAGIACMTLGLRAEFRSREVSHIQGG
ncbi:DUF6962 family protein [Fibrobacterota bacterium]